MPKRKPAARKPPTPAELIVRSYLTRAARGESNRQLLANMAMQLQSMEHLNKALEILRETHGLFKERPQETQTSRKVFTAAKDYLVATKPYMKSRLAALQGNHAIATKIAGFHGVGVEDLKNFLATQHGIVFHQNPAGLKAGEKPPVTLDAVQKQADTSEIERISRENLSEALRIFMYGPKNKTLERLREVARHNGVLEKHLRAALLKKGIKFSGAPKKE